MGKINVKYLRLKLRSQLKPNFGGIERSLDGSLQNFCQAFLPRTQHC